MTPLSQRDPRWANIKLGTSSVTIGGYGCTISSLAILLGTTPDVVNTRLKAVGGYANGNLVIWSKLSTAFKDIVSAERVFAYDNNRALQAINDNGGVLVEVDGSRIGAPIHWILYVGGGMCIDPWTGNKKETSYYATRTGMAIIKLADNPQEPMQGELEACLADRLKFWKERDEARAEVESLKKELEGKNAVISAKDEKWTKFIERVAGILGCPADGDNIIDFATRFSGEVDSALKYKDMYEREVQARKADYEASQSQLAKYDEAIHELRDDFTKEQEILEAKWMKKLDNLQAQVEKALARAKVAEDALQAHTKFAGFWKLFGRIKA